MQQLGKVVILVVVCLLLVFAQSPYAAELEVIKIASAPRVLKAITPSVDIAINKSSHAAPNGQIIQTILLDNWADETEEDEGDAKIESIAVGCTPKPTVNDGETFAGTSREIAKTRAAKATIEAPNLTVKSYHSSHPSDAEMRALSISKKCDTGRVEAENRNVTVVAYLIAAKKEDDNDFHFILQDKGCESPSCRLTVEVSGIPRVNGSKVDLKTARQYFEQQWPIYSGYNEVPGSGKYLFFETPILVRVTGSAFYDADHPVDPVSGTGPVGPEGYKPGSAWEVHPITSFEFDPQTEISLYALMSSNKSTGEQ